MYNRKTKKYTKSKQPIKKISLHGIYPDLEFLDAVESSLARKQKAVVRIRDCDNWDQPTCEYIQEKWNHIWEPRGLKIKYSKPNKCFFLTPCKPY